MVDVRDDFEKALDYTYTKETQSENRECVTELLFEKYTVCGHFPIEYLNMSSEKLTAFTMKVGKHKNTVIC